MRGRDARPACLALTTFSGGFATPPVVVTNLQPPRLAPPFPPPPNRRLLRAAVLAAEADGCEVDEALMQLYSSCLLGQQHDGALDRAGGADGSSPDASLLPPAPPPGWCYKQWTYAPAAESAAATLAAAEALQRAVGERRRAWLSQQGQGEQPQQHAPDAPPCFPPATAGDGTHGLLALHVSLNLLEGGTGCHEW